MVDAVMSEMLSVSSETAMFTAYPTLPLFPRTSRLASSILAQVTLLVILSLAH